jgi:RNA polymerase-associated protein LEO1
MANEDLIKDVFGGSDSESDEDGANAGGDAKMTDAPELGAALEDAEEHEIAVGGDASDEDDDVPAPKPGFRSSLEDPEAGNGSDDDDDDDDEDARGPSGPVAAPPMTVEKAFHDPFPKTVVPKLVKLTNIAGVEPRAFDQETFELTEDHHAKNHNVIRWRKNRETGAIESNARFVKWSDGSVQLLIGDESLDVNDASVDTENAFLFARHSGAMQARARLRGKLVFRPATLDSETHRRLTRAVDKKHVKSKQTRMHIEVRDPEAAKDAADREAMMREKEMDLLRKKRKEAMRGGGYGTGGGSGNASARVEAGYAEYFDRGAGLDGDFLEAEEEDEEEEDVAAAAAAEVKKSGIPRSSGGYDDEAAFEEDEEAPVAKKRRGRAIESDSE